MRRQFGFIPHPSSIIPSLTIGIDFTSAARERAGIGRYARELVRALSRVDSVNRYILFIPRDAHPDLLTFDFPPNFRIRRAPLTERILAALWQRARAPLPIEVFIGRVDVFYSPDFLLPPTLAKRTLVTVHDLSYVRVPDCFPTVLKNYLNRTVPRAIRRADVVLGDAASTCRDLQEIYGVPRDKTHVLYSGVDSRFCPDIPRADVERVRSKYDLAAPYLLSVSTLQPRKNYVRLIQAFHQLVPALPAALSNLQLVISGGKGWMYDEIFSTVEKLGLRDRVKLPGFADDADLPALYAQARLFVYPSLYEGFGLPVAEAMASGVPVVCSNASSIPEVAGDAAVYFDPLDVDGMAKAIQRALTDEPLASDLRNRGLNQIKQFSWDKAARELLGYLTASKSIEPIRQ